MSKRAWVEIDPETYVIIRIFKSRASCFASGKSMKSTDYGIAIKEIRHGLFLRSNGYCELCASPVIEQSGHMHEQVHRGKGGEVSLANSVFICPTCHRAAHADRTPKFLKKHLTSESDSGMIQPDSNTPGYRDND